MQAPEFFAFRLVGGTALSLQLGHRESVDIDLFTDAEYNSVDFEAIEKYLHAHFTYVDIPSKGLVGMGKSYYVGESDQASVKLDLFYTDTFIRPIVEIDGLRLASIDDIVAMKIDVILRTGRKKDFWDIHELLDDYSLEHMLSLHEERYPYTHEKETILNNFTQFEDADSEFDPICLRGKHWEIIKLDIVSEIQKLSRI
jgi:predicted nucleotidyltransferase component of viral defense system